MNQTVGLTQQRQPLSQRRSEVVVNDNSHSRDSSYQHSTGGAGSPPIEDDAVYGNKQLIAHLLRSVCSSPQQLNGQQLSQQPGSTSTATARMNGRNSNRRIHSCNSDSSRSRSPPEDGNGHHHFDSVDGAVLSSSSGFLTASSASGISLSAPSASPFALSPLSEALPWSQPAISLAVLKDGRTAELERIILQLCREFESRLHDRFENFSGQLDTEPATIRESVTRELETLFYDDSIHWGRIIAVFVLAKEICDKCLAEDRPQLAAAVQQWVAEFIDRNLWDWVRDNHGWYGLIQFYRDTGGHQPDRARLASIGSWQPMASLLALTAAASIALALAAAYFRR